MTDHDQWQDRIIETLEGDPAELVKFLHPDNPKNHPDNQREGIEHSLRKVGWVDRPTWNKRTGYFTDGNCRIELALMAGQKSIKYDVVDLSPEEEKYVLMTLDPLASMANPDPVKMLALMNDVGEDLPEGVAEHLLGMIGKTEVVEENGAGDMPPQVDRAQELQEKYGTCKGQIWRLGHHKIACIDSTNEKAIKQLIGDKAVEMIWADPPYGIKEDTNRHTKGRGNLTLSINWQPVIGDDRFFDPAFLLAMIVKTKIIWGANYFADKLPCVSSWIVWDKRDGVTSDDNADCEMAWTNTNRPARVFRHLWKGAIKASEHGQRRVHPTQKPVALPQWAFEKYGNPNDLIFDPFLGSGISIIAAKNLDDGRKVIGCELSPEYIAVIIQRWVDATGDDPVCVSSCQ